jgi:hypothetical protein
MNVEAPGWAGQVPNPQQPLSVGLRAAFATSPDLPPVLQRLLSRLEGAFSAR